MSRKSKTSIRVPAQAHAEGGREDGKEVDDYRHATPLSTKAAWTKPEQFFLYS
ncbi:hypothetical protein [Paenibacillus chitinolyticus]